MVEIPQERYGSDPDSFLFPLPIFELMQAELLEIDVQAGLLKARFPVLKSYLNPYRTMQGGMLATAVDNTIGPICAALHARTDPNTDRIKKKVPFRITGKGIII